MDCLENVFEFCKAKERRELSRVRKETNYVYSNISEKISLRYLTILVTERKKLWYFPKINSDSIKWVDCFPKIVVNRASQVNDYIDHIMKSSLRNKKITDKVFLIYLRNLLSEKESISKLFDHEFMNQFLNMGGGTVIDFVDYYNTL